LHQCLAEADIVCDEQPDARHAERTCQWLELVGVDLDNALERCEELAGVGLRRGSPSHCVEECIEPAGIVEARRLRERPRFEHAGGWFDLPDDSKGLVWFCVVLN
jgi:hypothetical protein